MGASRGRAPGRELVEVPEREFEALRVWRMGRAEGKPAFTVASDATLRELLSGPRPRSVDDLIGVRGIGPAFCAKHGESLLEALGGLEDGSGSASIRGRADVAQLVEHHSRKGSL